MLCRKPAVAALLLLLVAHCSLFAAAHAAQLPPALAAAAARAAAAANAHTAALSGAGVDPGATGHSRQPAVPPPHLQQQLQERRRLLAPTAPAGSKGIVAESRLANLTVGNATAGRENALRKALLEDYDSSVFPWAEYGPAQAFVNLAIHRILDVDLYGGTLKMAVWLRVEWWDPRLTWDKAAWNVSKTWFHNPQQGDTEIWEPDIVLWNSLTPILYTLGQEPIAVNASGRVFWSRPGVFEVACSFKGLSAFPFGRVRCELELGAWSYGPWYVNVSMQGKGYALGGSVTSGETAAWTEYRISSVEARRHTYPPYPCCPDESDWPVVLIDMALERQNLIYMMKVIVPQIILTAVAFSTFWLSPACGERLGLAVTVPLAVAVYDLLTYSQLPVSNKVTLVSALGMTAFLFSMAVLVENAFVIQLWHYSEHTYFKGASVFLGTFWAYKEQLVWVNLLGCIHQLKIELARRQLATLQARKVRSPSPASKSNLNISQKWHSVITSNTANHSQQHQQPPSQPSQQQPQSPSQSPQQPQKVTSAKWQQGLARALDVGAASAADTEPQQQQADHGSRPAVDTLLVSDASDAAAGPGGGDRSNPLNPQASSLLSPTRSEVLQQLGQLQTQLGGGAQADEAGDSLLLSCTTKEQLRLHLSSILNSDDPALSTIQRRIQKAFVVFGEDVVCSRVHAVLVGSQPSLTAPDTASDAGSETGDTSPQNLHVRLAGEFNRRWQLLSQMIDHICRYLFISAYALCMIVLTIALILTDE